MKLSNWKRPQTTSYWCRHRSVDQSATSTVPPRVRVPSIPSTLLSIYIDYKSLEGVLGNRTRDHWMVSSDESIKLRRPPIFLQYWALNYWFINCGGKSCCSIGPRRKSPKSWPNWKSWRKRWWWWWRPSLAVRQERDQNFFHIWSDSTFYHFLLSFGPFKCLFRVFSFLSDAILNVFCQGSCCGIVGRAVAFGTREPGFESIPEQFL